LKSWVRFNVFWRQYQISNFVFTEVLEKWPLFGSSFFAVRRDADPAERSESILALNRNGVHFLDVISHVSLISIQWWKYIFILILICCVTGNVSSLLLFRGDIYSQSQIGGGPPFLGHEMWKFDATARETHSNGSGPRDISSYPSVHYHLPKNPAA
jgi:hypothetical protein